LNVYIKYEFQNDHCYITKSSLHYGILSLNWCSVGSANHITYMIDVQSEHNYLYY